MISRDAVAIAIIFTDYVMFQPVAVSGVSLLTAMGVNPEWQGYFGP